MGNPGGTVLTKAGGDVYITDAGTFTTNGDVYCFDKDGKKKFSFEGGLNPSAMLIDFGEQLVAKK